MSAAFKFSQPSDDLVLEDGLSYNGRCVWGLNVGYIIEVNQRTYRVKWLDRSETEMLRPDLEDEE